MNSSAAGSVFKMMESVVSVVGGGPAGLAAGIALAQAGFKVTLFDHSVPPIDKACGEGLMPDGIVALEQLGVRIPLDAGLPFQGIAFSDRRHRAEADFPDGRGCGLRRIVLHELLRRRAEDVGVRCIWGERNPALKGFVVGADGLNSGVRRRFGLSAVQHESKRFGFRQHFRIPPWSPFVEVLWEDAFQVYVTPVSTDEVGIAVLTRDPGVRVQEAIDRFDDLRGRLRGVPVASTHRGCFTIQRTLRRVCGDGVALVGDASGSVDAITGEGLSVSFRQALALADALRAGDLNRYQMEHARLFRRPRLMARALLLLEQSPFLRRKTLASFSAAPEAFQSLLSFHLAGA